MNSGEDSAFPIISSSNSASHEYEGSVSLCRRIHPGRSLQKSLSSRSCRALGGDDIVEVDVQDREQVDSER